MEDFLEGVVNSVLCCLSCGIGCSTGFVVIALVWLFMRPLYGGILLAIAVGMCICVGFVRNSTKTVRGVKKGKKHTAMGDGAPVEHGIAEEFIHALKLEYLQSNEGAVGQFLDGQSPEDVNLLVEYEQRVQGSADKASAIRSIEDEWEVSESE